MYFLKWLVAFLFTYHFFYWFSPFLQKRKQTYCTWEITNNSSPFLLSCYWGFLWMWMAKAIMYSFFKAYSMETFTAWWVNSKYWYRTNCEDMSAISRGIHSSGSEFFFNHIAKATWVKLNIFSLCEPQQCANNWNPFKVNAFSRSFECEWLSFQFKIWQPFIFSKFVHFQDVYSSHELHIW